jgi:hypothetical protein
MESQRAASCGALNKGEGRTPVKKTEKENVVAIESRAQSRGSRTRKSDDAKEDLRGTITALRELVEQAASGGHVCHRLRRELTAAQRQDMLCKDGNALRGVYEARQLALLEETESLREVLSQLATFPALAKVLHLMVVLRGEEKDREHDPDLGWGLWHKAEDACQIMADVVSQWGQLSRLCELKDSPHAASLLDAPDLVAAAAAHAIPSEDKINAIVAAGITCVSLLEVFCGYRGIPTD